MGLGFRRLSIIDLSAGHQPMSADDEKLWIVFNGEIYNFPELQELIKSEGLHLQTRCDTEVILKLYQLYGADCLKYLRGMFAFAIWDGRKQKLFIARDRVGKKPLYYAVRGRTLYFASEMKALLEASDLDPKINLAAIPLYLTYQFIPSPMTIYQDVRRLPPGHYLEINAEGYLRLEQYWKLPREPKRAESFLDLARELKDKLAQATKIRLVADVPLGAFLSGGVDSSFIVGLMAEQMSSPVKTFSIGFEEDDFSELKYARQVADHFKTDHHEFIVKPEMAELLPKLAWHYDQPYADPSALPSYYVARETRKHVTVALNGDGGDENFGGYLRYRADAVFSAVALAPQPLRTLLAATIRKAPTVWKNNHLWRRVTRAATLLNQTPHEFNFKLFCYFDQAGLDRLLEPAFFSSLPPVYGYFESLYAGGAAGDFLDQVLACDTLGYLPECLLVKMDVASMANSLEARSPLLDQEIVEFAAKIPTRYKVRYNGGKFLLKEAAKGMLPREILSRRKMGFGVPLSRWFKGPLAGYLKDHLLAQSARERGYFRPREVERLITEHQSSAQDHGYKLWALLMFELWHKVFIDKR